MMSCFIHSSLSSAEYVANVVPNVQYIKYDNDDFYGFDDK